MQKKKRALKTTDSLVQGNAPGASLETSGPPFRSTTLLLPETEDHCRSNYWLPSLWAFAQDSGHLPGWRAGWEVKCQRGRDRLALSLDHLAPPCYSLNTWSAQIAIRFLHSKYCWPPRSLVIILCVFVACCFQTLHNWGQRKANSSFSLT